MKRIFVVNAFCGCSSDSQEWNVVAYTSEERAEEHKNNAQKEADRIYKDCQASKEYLIHEPNRFDPFMIFYDWERIIYMVSSVDLEDE